ncbi:MAG: VWA domain-containing protein [Bifidobacteriaceae bacterium]|jgi:hypothetical protein|nr:VWA domain-containing protein [Bifidobacteriaceae bacterium]
MTLQAGWAIPVAAGLLAVAAVVGVILARRRRRQGGTALANTSRFLALPAFGRVLRRHAATQVLSGLAVAVLAVGATIVAARPAESETITPEVRNRDVVLCLDVSGSMMEVDADLMESFQNLVKNFDGERVGLSVFNSSSVTLFPLTDDYAFLEEQLGEYARQLDAYWETWEIDGSDGGFDFSGTLIGEEYGSSLIGDGLAMCLDLFDRQNQERARSVVLATDNMVAGAPYLTLPEAAQLAKLKNVRMYAIDPGWGQYWDGWDIPSTYEMPEQAELREAAESTGGEYYTLDDGDSVRKIANSILSQEASLTETTPYRLVHDRAGLGTALAAVGAAGLVLVSALAALGRRRRRSE